MTGENCKIFHEQEAEKTLITLLETSDNAQVMGAAALALGVMAQSPICRVTIAEYGEFQFKLSKDVAFILSPLLSWPP